MKLVRLPEGFQKGKTYWCPKCDRFTDAFGTHIPSCPVHNIPMVDNPADPQRVESYAPFDNPGRRPRMRWHGQDEILRLTRSLEGIRSNKPIPVISNSEDDDLRHLAADGLLFRDQKVSISIPPPRYQWSGRLDPEWDDKFRPVLEQCDLAVYARRPGTTPNPATRLEIEILQNARKKIVVFELAI